MNIEATKAELIGLIQTTDDEQVLNETTSYLKQRLEVAVYTGEEAKLIDTIKNGLSEEFMVRHRELTLKFLRREITEEENIEYKKMIEKSEQFDVVRLRCIISLSEKWNTTIEDVMKRLNIQTPEPLSA